MIRENLENFFETYYCLNSQRQADKQKQPILRVLVILSLMEIVLSNEQYINCNILSLDKD
jgi:hypothetical protein